MCMFVCVCVCMCLYVCVCAVRVFACVCVRACVKHACEHVCMCVLLSSICTHTYIPVDRRDFSDVVVSLPIGRWKVLNHAHLLMVGVSPLLWTMPHLSSSPAHLSRQK